ncbi:PREDICTED: homeobox-leucine zipper protein HOX11-like isoform X2 [Ipomoea nil]|uniref:homeobox-leucine zipper protein HOX11-like isoform X2 n=1 Tax=Ipomoea nil TaxID=35883 RepID=UPI00090135CA|nr:PREDICTED: homeobox-leucine zipper protein HOX11-like isoform X2 [Ipomoea nil]
MELGLSVGGDSNSIPTLKPFSFLQIPASASAYEDQKNGRRGKDNNIGFCMAALGDEEPPLQLALLPLSPPPLPCAAAQPRFPWLSHNLGSEPGFLSNLPGFLSSPNTSGASSFPATGRKNVRWWSRKRDMMTERRASSNNNSVGSDEDDEINGGGLGRKKLRLTRQQSAFLEQTFKQHSTLNPNKVALAKQLNLRPRQVEVWFQNRRARTKLKQTEVDCEYLRRCCETLRDENKRLQKEVQELRALKTTSHPFYNHLPATTLNICPSCTAATTPSAAATNTARSLPKSEC